ncbi:MAG: peroxiredoxin [Polyangiaceae bacterium]|nr:peroxiredoxin [Polyangiaceae bacterium]
MIQLDYVSFRRSLSWRLWRQPSIVLLMLGIASLNGVSCTRVDKKAQPEAPPPSLIVEETEGAKGLRKAGERAPLFEGQLPDGKKFSLATLRDKIVILYFYPKNNTPGCTAEAKSFATHQVELEQAGAVVVGVSGDDQESHNAFAEKYSLPFLLVSDKKGELAKAYGVKRFLGMSQRVTFLIARDGTILKVYPEVRPEEHGAEILDDLRKVQ